MNIRNRVLLVIGVIMLIKAAWGLAAPESFRRFTAGWLKAVKHVNTLVGAACFVVALALGAVVLLGQPLVNWLLVLMAVLMMGGGVLYLRIPDLERLTGALILNRRSSAIRLIFGVSLLIALWVIWVAATT